MKKIILPKGRQRPGPKPKSEAEKARVINISLTAEMHRFVSRQESPSKYIQNLVRQDKTFQIQESKACRQDQKEN